MNKTILKQALLFQDERPPYSRVKELLQAILEYQNENECYFFHAKRGERCIIKSHELFFLFLSQTQNLSIKKFEDIENILNANTRAQNIQLTGNSKSNFLRVFDSVVVIKKRAHKPQLYKKVELDELSHISSFVAIENGETFLNIESFADNFSEEYFLYLAGYANSATREFLQSKEVQFFVDFDIEGLNIYESFVCKKKSIHLPLNIEAFFQSEKYSNVELYKKQRAKFKESYSPELEPIVKLIQKYNTVVEQEIVYETY